MEVKIGVQYASRELVIETNDSSDEVEQRVAEAVAKEGVLTLVDSKGRKVIVPAAKVAYVEIGGGVSGTVGFRS